MLLFRFILIFILLYLIISFVGRMLFVSAANKARGNVHSQSRDYFKRKEGEVTILGNRTGKKKNIENDLGEYVNFEEVEEND